MSRLDDWRSTSRLSAPTASERAAAAWARINRKPDTITIIRAGVAQAAQVVRIEINASANATDLSANSGTSSRRYVTIFGIQGHSTQADTDIQRGDKFKYLAAGNLANYEVLSVDKTQIGDIQAVAEMLE
jgi:hypothetical protein